MKKGNFISKKEWKIETKAIKYGNYIKAITAYRGDKRRIVTPSGVEWIDSFGNEQVDDSSNQRTLIVRGYIKGISPEALKKQNIEKVIIQEGVEEIHSEAFANNPLIEIELPSTLTFIEIYAFNCAEIGKLTVYPIKSVYEYLATKFRTQWIKELNIINADPFDNGEQVLQMLESLHFQNIVIEKINILGQPLPTQIYIKACDLFPKRPINNDPPPLDEYSNGFNLEDEDWTIKDGVLLEFRGDPKSIVIPEGVTVIEEKAFSNKGLRRVVLPQSLRKIKSHAFSANDIKHIMLPPNVCHIGYRAFINTTLSTLEIPHNCDIIKNGSFYNTNLKKLVVTDSNLSQLMNQAIGYTGRIRELTIYNETLTLDEILAILKNRGFPKLQEVTLIGKEHSNALKMFSKALTKNKKKDRNLSREKRPFLPVFVKNVLPQNATRELPVQDIKELEGHQDQEIPNDIERIVMEIESIAELLLPEDKKKIKAKVNSLLEEYENLLSSMAITCSSMSKEPQLSYIPTSPIIQKAILLERLENIYSELNQNNSVEFLKDLESYKNALNTPVESKPESLDETKDKVKYLIFFATHYCIQSLKNDISNLIEETYHNWSNTLTSFLGNEVTLRNNHRTNFINEIDSMFKKVNSIEPFFQTLYGESDTPISKKVRWLTLAIDSLYETDRLTYKNVLDSLIKKYKYLFFRNDPIITEQNLEEELDVINANLEKMLGHSKMRKEAFQIIEECAKATREGDHEEQSSNEISEIVLEIKSLINRSVFTDTEREEFLNDVKKIISNWSTVIREDLLSEKISKVAPIDGDDTDIKWLGLDETLVAKIYIMKELYAVKIQVEDVIRQRTALDGFKKELKFFKKKSN